LIKCLTNVNNLSLSLLTTSITTNIETKMLETNLGSDKMVLGQTHQNSLHYFEVV
jgi:hypothetical protein